ncbi:MULTISPECIES: lipase family protein [unclassified Nitrospina]|uniref:lipase family protein n=1 Tax=unclassified Nitrospina TaxID=2638683 RepID=UPI003F9A1DA7
MKLKPLPTDYSFNNLFFPNMDRTYFEDAEALPFQATATGFNWVNAWWLAEASLLVYVRDEQYVFTTLKEAGFKFIELIGFERPGTQCFIAGRSHFLLLVFRGTEVSEEADILTDIDLIHSSHRKKGKIHKGFGKALNQVWEEVDIHLKKYRNGCPLWIGGHSLGGALAVLAAHWFGGVQGVYTFGCPRVGNRTFRDAYAIPTYRFVNNNDVIARVPPPTGYRHVGQLKYIDNKGTIRDSISWGDRIWEWIAGSFHHHINIIKQLKNTHSSYQIKTDQLVDHAPIWYANRIWNHYTKPPLN